MSDSEQIPEQTIETELPLDVKLEALLFVAVEPVATAQLATALDVLSRSSNADLTNWTLPYKAGACVCNDMPGACN